MKAHIGVDSASGLTYDVVTTPANTVDITKADKLLHNEEEIVIADAAGYRGIEKRKEHQERQVA